MYTKQNLIKDVTAIVWVVSLMVTGLVLINKFQDYESQNEQKKFRKRILFCTSEKEAETVCLNKKEKYGLTGMYYCETSSGHLFQI